MGVPSTSHHHLNQHSLVKTGKYGDSAGPMLSQTGSTLVPPLAKGGGETLYLPSPHLRKPAFT